MKAEQLTNEEEKEILNELEKMLRNPKVVNLKMTSYALWVLIANCQLALKHPNNTGEIANKCKQQITEIVKELSKDYPPLEKLFAKGWGDISMPIGIAEEETPTPECDDSFSA